MIGTTRKSLKNCFRKLYGMLCLDMGTVVEISTFKNQEKSVESAHFYPK